MTEKNMVNLIVTTTRKERKARKQIAQDKDIAVVAILRQSLREYQTMREKGRSATDKYCKRSTKKTHRGMKVTCLTIRQGEVLALLRSCSPLANSNPDEKQKKT